MATIYNGTLYDIGSFIPGHVNDPVNHKVWYDVSKKYDTDNGIFSELGISEIRYLGDDESNNKNLDEIMNSIMQYLNLHMIQIGYDIFIFDWYTQRHKSLMRWKEINTNETRTNVLGTITVTQNMYRGNDSNISIDDVYNKISATCEIDNDTDFLKSPLDSSELYNYYPTPEKYMTEYIAPRNGDGKRARDRFIKLMLYNKSEAYTDDDKMQSKWCDWWFALRKSKNWKFKRNGTDNYSFVETDQYDNKINQWKFPYYLQTVQFFSGIVSFGHGEPITLFNQTNQQNITSFTDYIAINISGDANTHPNSSDLQNSNMSIEYENNKMYNYTPVDNNVTNYIIFSGKMELTPWQQKSGPKYPNGSMMSEDTTAYDQYLHGREWNTFNDELEYIKNNAQYPANYSSNMGNDAGKHRVIKGHEVPGGSESDRDEQYYQQLFYCNEYGSQIPTADKTQVLLSPPIDGGKYYKKLKYGIGRNSYYKDDEIPYVPIIECELKIGDKYCVEQYMTDENHIARPYYTWCTADELPTYVDETTNTVLKKSTITLGFNPQKDEYIIGEPHDIYNNITTDMMLSSTGTAIPIKKTDNVNGTLSFKILGPVNTVWDDGVHRHGIWFKSPKDYENKLHILPHVKTLFIESFDIKFESDNGKIKDQNTNDDLVYESDETKQYINKKDDITFDINTALTSDEAYHYNVNITTNRNNVLDNNNQPILAITDTNTNETDKPEKIYVDAYYNEYNSPKLIFDTTLQDDPQRINMFYKYVIDYMNKTFAPVYINRNLAMNTATIKMKEI